MYLEMKAKVMSELEDELNSYSEKEYKLPSNS